MVGTDETPADFNRYARDPQMPLSPREHISFLIRLWRDKDSQAWRGIVITPQTGERRGFTSHQALWNFIKKQIDDISQGENEPMD